jgi:hypothetical protein
MPGLSIRWEYPTDCCVATDPSGSFSEPQDAIRQHARDFAEAFVAR